jgi:cyclophilin family peptidyl-prolyl cis-trans isomerase
MRGLWLVALCLVAGCAGDRIGGRPVTGLGIDPRRAEYPGLPAGGARVASKERDAFFASGPGGVLDKAKLLPAKAEVALTQFKPAEALRLLDQFDKDTAEWEGLGAEERVALGWLSEHAHEVRFIATIFSDDPDAAKLKELYATYPDRLFDRFCADGTTNSGPACYRYYRISGKRTEADRAFDVMLAVLEGDANAIKRFRLLAMRAGTIVGMADAGGQEALDAATAALAALPQAKVEDLPEYGSCRLMPALMLARAGDFAAAHELVQAIVDAGYPASMKPRIDRYIPGLNEIAEAWKAEQTLIAAEKDLPRVEFETDQGRIVITLFEDDAPNTVASFITLTEQGFYDGLVFHRVVPHFVVQGGDPDGTGSGGPGYSIKCEMGRKHFRGSLGMARSEDPDSAGSQFYFCLSAATTHHLDAGYCVFGRVSEGLDVMDKLRLGGKVIKARVLNRRAHDYKVDKLAVKE